MSNPSVTYAWRYRNGSEPSVAPPRQALPGPVAWPHLSTVNGGLPWRSQPFGNAATLCRVEKSRSGQDGLRSLLARCEKPRAMHCRAQTTRGGDRRARLPCVEF